MKKIFVLACVCLLLFVSSASAVGGGNPFRVHSGGFGPVIAGLQLGIHVGLEQLVMTGLDWFGKDSMELVFNFDKTEG